MISIHKGRSKLKKKELFDLKLDFKELEEFKFKVKKGITLIS